MKSIKVCVRAIDTTKIIAFWLERVRNERNERRIIARRFVCIPGIKPVKVPQIIPTTIMGIISSILFK